MDLHNHIHDDDNHPLMLKMTMTLNQIYTVMLCVWRWLISPIHTRKTLLQQDIVGFKAGERHVGVSCSVLPLLMLLDGLIDSMLFIGSHPSVEQAMPDGMILVSFLPSVNTEATAFKGDFQSVFAVLLLASLGAFACFQLTL